MKIVTRICLHSPAAISEVNSELNVSIKCESKRTLKVFWFRNHSYSYSYYGTVLLRQHWTNFLSCRFPKNLEKNDQQIVKGVRNFELLVGAVRSLGIISGCKLEEIILN